MAKPEIRLKGFEGEWKNTPLYECLTISNERNSSNEFKKENVLSVSDDFGIINQIKHLGRSYAGKDISNYKIVRPSQIVYTKSPLRAKPYGIIKNNVIETGIVSVLYAVYNVTKDVCPEFVNWYFTPSYRTNNYLLPLINKGAKNTINVTDEMALQGSIIIPKKEEQLAIADFFKSLDSMIQGVTKKIASLKQMKQACLVSMFPQEGETTPRVRFKGFKGEWEKKILNDCLDISHEKNLDNRYGKNDVLSVSDDCGVMNQIELLGRSYAGKSVSNYGVLNNGEIVYTKSPLKSKPYGIVKMNTGKTGIVSVLYAIYVAKENTSTGFIHYYFDPAWRLNAYLLPLVNKGAKNTMNISDEMALTGYIMIPKDIREQQKIATYFTSLDKQISLQEARLEKMKQIKSACLDKMFV